MANQRQSETREEYLARRKQYRETHKEEITAYSRVYRELHRQDRRVYREQNKHHILEQHRQYNHDHYDALYAYRRQDQVKTRERANGAVAAAIVAGKIVPPATCQRCGRIGGTTSNGSRQIEAHHHHGYDQDHWLDVVWLCGECHAEEHRNVRADNSSSLSVLH